MAGPQSPPLTAQAELIKAIGKTGRALRTLPS
jgi:hypothetical protein